MGPTFVLNNVTLTLKMGRGEMIVEIKKLAFFDNGGKMNSSLRILRIDKFCKRNFVKCCKCTRRPFFALSMSALRSRTCCARLWPRWVSSRRCFSMWDTFSVSWSYSPRSLDGKSYIFHPNVAIPQPVWTSAAGKDCSEVTWPLIQWPNL